jgi:c-di-GMP phosphodiesterase
MILDTTPHISSVAQVKEFFLARQPILDRNQNLIAYELLFRRTGVRAPVSAEDTRGAASIIAHTSELGIENVTGSALGFFNVNSTLLMGDLVNFLPAEKVVFEFPQTDKITPELVRRVAELTHAGYRFALDDVITLSEYIKPLLPLVEIIKIDTSVMTCADLAMLVRQFKQAHKVLLADKVETIEQFQNCLELGFDYYQGYYFAKPALLSGKKLATSQLAIMELMTLVARDADTIEIEQRIKKEVSLCLSLLRLVNTPGMGVTKSIHSLSEALLVLGRRQLQRWLQIQIYVGPAPQIQFGSPLLLLAATRGKLLELVAQKLQPANRSMADIAFTVGILSLLDALFGQHMERILRQIVLSEEITEALLYRTGFYGDLLKLAEYLEKPGEAGRLLMPLLARLGLPIEELYPFQLEAFEWSNSLLPNL